MNAHRCLGAVALLSVLVAGCAPRVDPVDAAAERYVKLVVQLGHHDPDEVDAYYGPQEWRAEADRDSLPLARIVAVADSLRAALAHLPQSATPLARQRVHALDRQLAALAARARIVGGARLPFDQESQALYDVTAPAVSDSQLAMVVARLDSLLPGSGPLADRYQAFRKQFEIPPARLDTVFRAAIAEARRRTHAHVALPDSESFTVSFVTGKPWGGYNWYFGRYHSRIDVNTDLPVRIDRAIDLACHEGYPGHHVYNVMMEQSLVRGRGWKEFTIWPLYSPQGLIGEGTAVVAPDIAFPGAERLAFEKRVLYPLAGIDTSLADRFAAIDHAMRDLNGAGVEWTRRMLDGRMTEDQAIAWQEKYELQTPERARHALPFAREYRSYVVNYSVGEQMVRAWLAKHGGGPEAPDRRWKLYTSLLAAPVTPDERR